MGKMEICCVSCKKNTANKNSSGRRTKQNRSMLLSNCGIFPERKSRFVKNQEATYLANTGPKDVLRMFNSNVARTSPKHTI